MTSIDSFYWSNERLLLLPFHPDREFYMPTFPTPEQQFYLLLSGQYISLCPIPLIKDRESWITQNTFINQLELS